MKNSLLSKLVKGGNTEKCLLGGQSKIILFAIFLMLISNTALRAQAPADFKVEAFGGSYAPYGSNYELVIDSAGTCNYLWSDLETDSTYEITISITSDQMDSLYDTVTVVSFFSLNNLYEGNWADGSGIVLRITASNQTHSVEAKNYELLALNRIVWFINDMLSSSGVDLNYHFRGN